MTVAVLGLGNIMRTDDGVGVHAARMLATDRRLPADVQTIEGGTLGLDLLHSLQGITHVLALDAVDTGAAPGTLLRFANAELARLPVARSVHLLGFSDILNTLRLLGDAPDEVVLLGVQPESTDWGVAVSSVVDAALNDLVTAAIAQITTWRHELEENQQSWALAY